MTVSVEKVPLSAVRGTGTTGRGTGSRETGQRCLEKVTLSRAIGRVSLQIVPLSRETAPLPMNLVTFSTGTVTRSSQSVRRSTGTVTRSAGTVTRSTESVTRSTGPVPFCTPLCCAALPRVSRAAREYRSRRFLRTSFGPRRGQVTFDGPESRGVQCRRRESLSPVRSPAPLDGARRDG